jgi:hypothetical protein
MALLSSSSDILAFAATCRSWRAALVSFPSTLSCNVPLSACSHTSIILIVVTAVSTTVFCTTASGSSLIL